MEAVNMFVEINPDIILMDMKMPNLDGLDATKIIRELSPGVPIIALTAFAYDHDRKAALEAGCNDFLTKPFTQEKLKETIKKWVNKWLTHLSLITQRYRFFEYRQSHRPYSQYRLVWRISLRHVRWIRSISFRILPTGWRGNRTLHHAGIYALWTEPRKDLPQILPTTPVLYPVQ